MYRILGKPLIYEFVQHLFAPGSRGILRRQFTALLDRLPPAERLLDVGGGPLSLLWGFGLAPLGLDITFSYSTAYHRRHGLAVNGSAAALPFADESVDGVWTVGLLHHLPDELARQAVNEMVRVCRPGGYVVIFDALLPVSKWRRPIAYAIRQMDRGKFVREESHWRALLPPEVPFKVKRMPYARNGMESILACWMREG